MIHGGGQEHRVRSGTENVAGIAGFGRAAEMAPRYLSEMKRIKELRDRLEQGIKAAAPGSYLNGHREERLPNTLNITVPGFRGESIVLEMDKRGVYFSSGSACHSGSPEPSHVLLAMGLSEEEAHCALRLSLGHGTKAEEIDYTVRMFKELIENSKNMVRFISCK